jgi:hypothetical protein
MEVNFGTKDKPHWRYVQHVMKGCKLPTREASKTK